MKKLAIVFLFLFSIGLIVACSSDSDHPATGDTGSLTAQEILIYMEQIISTLPELTDQELSSIRAFAEADDGQPLYMVYMSRSHAAPAYSADWDGQRGTGIAETMALYMAFYEDALNPYGAYSLTGLREPASNTLSYSSTDSEEWDNFYVIYYPSRRAVLETMLHRSYQEAWAHKTATERETLMIPGSAGVVNEFINEPVEITDPMEVDYIETALISIAENFRMNGMAETQIEKNIQAYRNFALADDGAPFNMVNLIIPRDEPVYPEGYTGIKGTTINETKALYSRYAGEIMVKSGATSIFGISYCEEPVFYPADHRDEWAQFYLVYYPSRKAFIDLLAAPEYGLAFAHKEAGDADTLLRPVVHGKIAIQ